MLGTAHVRKAGGWRRSQALARLWPPRWLPRLATGSSSDQDATLPPGSGWCRSSIRPAARSGSAVSPSRAIATCGGCWLLALWPSFDMGGSTARRDLGSHGELRGDPQRWLQLRSPTGSRGWPGPSWFAARDTRSRSCCWQREYTNWRGHDDVVQKRSFRGSGEPAWVSAL